MAAPPKYTKHDRIPKIIVELRNKHVKNGISNKKKKASKCVC